MKIFGIIGLIIIAAAIWLKNEKAQDVLFIIGGLSLLVYSIYIEDAIFIVLQALFILSSLAELLKLKKKI